MVQDFRDEQVDQAVGLVDGRSMVRAWRWASARTCQSCQVDRLCSSTATIRSAVWPTQSSIRHAGGICCRREGGVDHGRDGVAAAEDLIGFVQPGGPLFGCERGSCLASRVSNVACWASWRASTAVGGRP